MIIASTNLVVSFLVIYSISMLLAFFLGSMLSEINKE